MDLGFMGLGLRARFQGFWIQGQEVLDSGFRGFGFRS